MALVTTSTSNLKARGLLELTKSKQKKGASGFLSSSSYLRHLSMRLSLVSLASLFHRRVWHQEKVRDSRRKQARTQFKLMPPFFLSFYFTAGT